MQDKVVEILKSYAVNYPLLASINMILEMPIAIVAEDMKTGISIIRTFSRNPVIIDSSWTISAVKEALTTTVSEAVVWIRPDVKRRSTHSQEIEELLLTAALIGNVGKREASVAIFFLINRFVDEELKGRVFEVYINTKGVELLFNKDKVVPKNTEVSDILSKLLPSNSGNNVHPVTAAAYFIKTDELEKYIGIAQTMIREAEESCYNNDLGMAVMNELSDYIRNNKVPVYNIRSLEDTSIEEFEKLVILEDDTMMITETFFKKAASNIINNVPVGLIKGKLVETAVLLPSLDGYTRKVQVKTKTFKGRVRVLKFDVSKYHQISSLKY